jgi:diguanylate cyclase (GGDEF)-like protein
MFDIDRFKDINDTHGHIFGNAVLEMVGEDLHKAIDGYGIVSRWGGDEFLGVLETDSEKAKQILEQYMESLRSEEKEEDYRVSISVGIAEVNTKLSLEQMVKQVDKALYSSKESGRNQISIS